MAAMKTPPTNSLITVKNLTKRYGSFHALANLSFEVARGEVIVIIGPSGGGKSTFLRTLMQLEKIDSGEIHLDKTCVVHTNSFGRVEYAKPSILRRVKLKVGMVFQNFPLFPHMTVYENLTMAPMLLKKNNKKHTAVIVEQLLEKIGMREKSSSYPCELSGGQKQRVAIARALAMEPEIILFDEPTSALDPELVNSIISIIKVLAIENKKTVIITTHQLNFAANLAQKLVFMDKGKIVEVGTPEELLNNPRNARLQKFLKRHLAVSGATR